MTPAQSNGIRELTSPELARIRVWMDVGCLLLWIFCLELAEFVYHRESADRQVSGPMCLYLGGDSHVSRRLQELRRPDGCSLLPRPRGSGHCTGFCADYWYVLETQRTAYPVSCPKTRLFGYILTSVMPVNPVGSLETVSQRFSVAWFPMASAVSTLASPAGNFYLSSSAPLPLAMAFFCSLCCRTLLRKLYSCAKGSALSPCTEHWKTRRV